MCLAIPARIQKLNDNHLALVEFQGNTLTVEMGLVDADIGDYVLVHAGCAIERIAPETANEIYDLLREMAE